MTAHAAGWPGWWLHAAVARGAVGNVRGGAAGARSPPGGKRIANARRRLYCFPCSLAARLFVPIPVPAEEVAPTPLAAVATAGRHRRDSRDSHRGASARSRLRCGRCLRARADDAGNSATGEPR